MVVAAVIGALGGLIASYPGELEAVLTGLVFAALGYRWGWNDLRDELRRA